MKKSFFVIIAVVLLSCHNSNVNTASKVIVQSDSVTKVKTDTAKAVIDIHLKSFMDTLHPIYGYRFVIKGDFDGDGTKETLTEHYKSSLDHKETCKYYSNLDYDKTVELTVQKQPYCYISCSSDKVDSLLIASSAQLSGLSLLHNEGDLDGNGTDEISYVVNWADWSSMNTCHIMTFTKKGWTELYKFSIHDWSIPATPESSASFGLFGVDGLNHYPEDDTLNKRLEKNLSDFSLIRRIKKGVIEVSEMKMEEDANDSVAVGDEMKKIIHLKK